RAPAADSLALSSRSPARIASSRAACWGSRVTRRPRALRRSIRSDVYSCGQCSGWISHDLAAKGDGFGEQGDVGRERQGPRRARPARSPRVRPPIRLARGIKASLFRAGSPRSSRQGPCFRERPKLPHYSASEAFSGTGLACLAFGLEAGVAGFASDSGFVAAGAAALSDAAGAAGGAAGVPVAS